MYIGVAPLDHFREGRVNRMRRSSSLLEFLAWLVRPADHSDQFTSDERQLFNAVAAGSIWDGTARTIRAETIVKLCTGQLSNLKETVRSIRIRGAKVDGDLDLSGLTIAFGLQFDKCRFDRVVLDHAEVRTMFFSGCTVVRGFTAEHLKIHGSLFLNNGFTSEGSVNLEGASIEGTLYAVGIRLGGPVSEGEGGSGSDKIALNAPRVIVQGAVSLNKAEIFGKVVLNNAKIGGSLEADNARIINTPGHSLDAYDSEIDGSVFLSEIKARGTVRFAGAKIGGAFVCPAGEIRAGHEGQALQLHRISVKQHIILNRSINERPGFAAIGRVDLSGAQVDGNVDCWGASFQSASDTKKPSVVFVLNHAKISGKLSWRQINAAGGVDFARAHVGSLSDDLESWPAKGRLLIDGFTYEVFDPLAPMMQGESASSQPRTSKRTRKEMLKRRIDWVKLQDVYRPQPYEQVAQVFRRMGFEEEARRCQIAKRDDLRESGQLGLLGRCGNWILSVTIGHGYRPRRSLVVAALFVAVGAGIFEYSFLQRAMSPVKLTATPTNKQQSLTQRCPAAYPCFNPVIYSLDVFLPIIDLHQQSHWMPVQAETWGIFQSYYWLHIFAGWTVTTLAVAGFTGLVKKEG
jgi:hypothetical protein